MVCYSTSVLSSTVVLENVQTSFFVFCVVGSIIAAIFYFRHRLLFCMEQLDSQVLPEKNESWEKIEKSVELIIKANSFFFGHKTWLEKVNSKAKLRNGSEHAASTATYLELDRYVLYSKIIFPWYYCKKEEESIRPSIFWIPRNRARTNI